MKENPMQSKANKMTARAAALSVTIEKTEILPHARYLKNCQIAIFVLKVFYFSVKYRHASKKNLEKKVNMRTCYKNAIFIICTDPSVSDG